MCIKLLCIIVFLISVNFFVVWKIFSCISLANKSISWSTAMKIVFELMVIVRAFEVKCIDVILRFAVGKVSLESFNLGN